MSFISKILLASFTSLCSILALAQQNLDDGPFLRYQASGVQAQWFCDEQIQTQSWQLEHAFTIAPRCGFTRDITVRQAQSQFPVETHFQAKKIAAISDIHGQYASMKQLLQANAIIDTELNWTFGDGHLVITGDVLDRGDQVNEALWLLYKLEAQAEQAGGKVHLLLGNHEFMVIANDLRYVHPKYAKVATAMGITTPDFYGEQSVLGRWLRAKPVIIQINDSLYMHGGIHPDFLTLQKSLPEVNELFRSSFAMSKADLKQHPQLNFLRGTLGPLWYRGYFTSPQLPETELDTLLQQLQVKRIIVGHTTLATIRSHYQGKVISIDADMKSGKGGEVLRFEEGVWWRGDLGEGRLDL